jgi:hypothetical protein
MADHESEGLRDLEWVRPPSASIGTLLHEEPAALPAGTLKHSWREKFGSRDGFGAPSAHRRRRAVRRLAGITMLTVVLLSVLTACGLLAVSAVKDAKQHSIRRAKAALAAGDKRGPRTKVGGNKEESKRDVSIRSCQPNDVGFTAADVVVTNHSRTAADYVVAVDFSSPVGRKAGTGYVTVNDVDPGKSSPVLLASSFKPAPEGGYGCHVGEVTRLTY